MSLSRARWERNCVSTVTDLFLAVGRSARGARFSLKRTAAIFRESISAYGEVVGLGVDWFAFSLSLAAFAVACCRRSESDFSRSASGVLCGLTVALSSGREQPPTANKLRARIRRRMFFMILVKLGMGEDYAARIATRRRRSQQSKNKSAARKVVRHLSISNLSARFYRGA